MKHIALAACLALVAWSERAVAQAHYEAPEGCPTDDAVRQSARERLPEGTTWSMVIARDAARYRGTIDVGDFRRELASDRCAAVVDALLLAAGLAVREARDAMVERDVDAARPGPPAVLVDPGPLRTGAARGRVKAALAMWAGAEVHVGSFFGGSALPSFALSFGLGPNEAPQPMFTLAAERSLVIGVGVAKLARTAGRLDACPLQSRIAPAASLGACAAFDVGAIDARAEGSGARAPTSRLWLSAGAGARAALHVGDFAVDATLGVFVPFTSDRFLTASDTLEMSPVGISLGLAGRTHFL